MSKPNDGGPAFPMPCCAACGCVNLMGMSHRTYMATQFVAAILGNTEAGDAINDLTNSSEEGTEVLVIIAIQHADALLKALENS